MAPNQSRLRRAGRYPSPISGSRSKGVVGPGRLELPTSRLSGVRSNQAELRAFGSETPGSQQDAGYPCGLAIAPPDLTAGGEWKEKRRRRYPAYCFLVSLDVPIDREDLEGHP